MEDYGMCPWVSHLCAEIQRRKSSSQTKRTVKSAKTHWQERWWHIRGAEKKIGEGAGEGNRAQTKQNLGPKWENVGI